MNIPQAVSDITYERFIEIKKVEQAFLEEPTIERMIQVTKFYHSSDVPIGDMPPVGFTYGLGEAVTHTKTYCHVVNLINSYKPEKTERFKHNGKTWVANSIVTDKMTVNEYVIAVECERRLSEIQEHKKDLDGQIEFSLTLREFSALVRLDGEDIPIDKRDREKWFTERMTIFATLPMDTVLNVNAFFLNTILDYGKNMTLSHTSKESQNTQANKAEKRAGQKAGKKNGGKTSGSVLATIRSMLNLWR